MLQSAWRRRLGLRALRRRLAAVVSKVLDAASGAHSYWDSRTGAVSWYKPALMGSEDVEKYQVSSAHNLRYGSYSIEY
jgi:hypothetical protein